VKHIGFTGTARGLTPGQLHELRTTLEWLIRHHGPITLHHGDCVGADAQAHTVAKELGCPVVLHPPDNPVARAWKFGPGDGMRVPKPYLVRNRDIVRETDILVAGPAQDQEVLRSGTWATVRAARKAGQVVILLHRKKQGNLFGSEAFSSTRRQNGQEETD
jgi:hypothetical protein